MPSPTHIVLATRNKGKVAELSALLSGFGLTVQSLDDFPQVGEIPETGETFEDNALIKARAVAQATGLVALADDSGLVVDALGGAPGVRSARFSGEEASDQANNDKLLTLMAGVESARRSCRFVSVVAAAAPNGETLTARGEWEGMVLDAPRGSGGFGYDPLFLDPEAGKTAAQMSPQEKNSRSHRAKALAKLTQLWPNFWSRLSI